MKSDAQLLAAARTDASAFRALYDRYAERIHGFHLRRTRDPEAAFDLTAETFARAWLARERFRDEADGSAAPWLYGIARNALSEAVRRRRLELDACARLGVLDRLDREPATAEPDDSWLDDMLDDLPAGQREAVELRVVDDLAYDEIAASLGTTPLAARVRVSRGLSTLRRRLEARR